MKSSYNLSWKLYGGLLAALLGMLSYSSVHAQIFVTNNNGNSIGEYNLDGSTVNASLVSSGSNSPIGVAISGNDLFVANYNSHTIGE